VIVGNEGNFGSGNATLTNYLVENNSANDGVFLEANGTGIGDVVQSLSWINGSIYVVVNNSQKIVVLDPETFQQTGQISLGENASPQQIMQVSESKAYVTDLYASLAYVVNLEDHSVSETTIPAGVNPDRMAQFEEYAYIANSGFGADSTIFKVDIATDAVVDTFEVSRGPSGMRIDADGILWVVSTGYSGDYDDEFNLVPGTSRPGGVHGIDLETGEEVAFAELPSAGSDLAFNPNDNKLYVNTGGVRAFDIVEETFSADTLYKGSFYGMGYDDVSGNFYLANARDFSSAGEVIIYNEATAEADSFDTGVNPGSFLFLYEDMLGTSTEETELASGFELSQNYPNPFNPTTNIEYSTERAGQVKLEVYNITGQKVAELVNARQSAGVKSVQFDASHLSSGLYIYRIITPSGMLSRKLTLIK
tara:strand:- start:69335 stop:70597 length:1263 start_codon:yes stop_codon:yes gene_type:complete